MAVIPEAEWLDFPSAVRLAALDAQQVRLAILRAAESDQLVMRYEPAFFGRRWRDFEEEDNPLWCKGLLVFPVGPDSRMNVFRPEISRYSIVRLFGLDAADKQFAVGRPSGTGYRKFDLLLVEKMRAAMQGGQANSWGKAAAMFVSRAEGHGTIENKIKRLARLAARMEKKGAK